MVFVVEGGDGLLTHGDEVVNKDLVRDVGVKVILEVLNLIHLGLNALVSSNSWEGERSVKEFPGVDLWGFLAELFGDGHGVVVVLNIEFSRELVHLPIHLILGDPESLFAGTLGWGEGINNTIITLEINKGFNRGLRSRDSSDEKKGNKG